MMFLFHPDWFTVVRLDTKHVPCVQILQDIVTPPKRYFGKEIFPVITVDGRNPASQVVQDFFRQQYFNVFH